MILKLTKSAILNKMNLIKLAPCTFKPMDLEMEKNWNTTAL